MTDTVSRLSDKQRRAFEGKFRRVPEDEAVPIEDAINRGNLLATITDLAGDGPVSLWELFERLATPLNTEQAAVLYAVEELWGRGDIEHANAEHVTEFVTAVVDVAPVGSPAWFRRDVPEEK